MLTKEQAAAYLALKPRELMFWSKRGVLPAPKVIGRHKRWDKKALDDYLDGGAESAPEDLGKGAWGNVGSYEIRHRKTP